MEYLMEQAYYAIGSISADVLRKAKVTGKKRLSGGFAAEARQGFVWACSAWSDMYGADFLRGKVEIYSAACLAAPEKEPYPAIARGNFWIEPGSGAFFSEMGLGGAYIRPDYYDRFSQLKLPK